MSGPRSSPDGEYVSPESLPGALIDEKYRVDRIIGRGGVGLVVAATHLGMAQRVAIKMIRDDVPMQRELLDRFQREARAAAMMRSEHVARVLDVGRLPTGRPYIVMEYLEGEDLEQVIGRGPIPVTMAVDYVLQACEALAEAHRAGIIHRDLKPANLFLTRRPDGSPLIKLLDFGISKVQPLTAARENRSVETTSIMGSPGYMAPEQMKSTRDVDARADVWSLGTVLYESVVGQPAFEGSTMLEILDSIAICSPTPPSARVPNVPPELDAVIGWCLRREPENRYASVADLAVALQPFASPASAGLAERAVRISREPMPEREELHFSVFQSEPRPSALTVITPAARKRALRTKSLFLTLGVLGLGTTLWFVRQLRAGPAPTPDSFAEAAASPASVAASAPASRGPWPEASVDVWPRVGTTGSAATVGTVPSREVMPSSRVTHSAAPGTPAYPAPVRKALPRPLASSPADLSSFGDRK